VEKHEYCSCQEYSEAIADHAPLHVRLKTRRDCECDGVEARSQHVNGNASAPSPHLRQSSVGIVPPLHALLVVAKEQHVGTICRLFQAVIKESTNNATSSRRTL
jgi:hypothetical protein